MAWRYRLERIGFPFTASEASGSVANRVIEAFLEKAKNESYTPRYPTTTQLSAEEILNELGRDGWELVAVLTDEKGMIAVMKQRADDFGTD